MSSSSSKRRKRLSDEIKAEGIEMAPCANCKKAKVPFGTKRPKCIVGPKSGKCSECVRKGCRDCDVTITRPEWERVRDMREKLRRELQESEEKEVELMHKMFLHRARTLRLRKQLQQAERRTDEAVAQELEDLEEAERVEEEFFAGMNTTGVEVAEAPYFMSDVLSMPPDDWALVGGEPSSSSSWDLSAGTAATAGGNS